MVEEEEKEGKKGVRMEDGTVRIQLIYLNECGLLYKNVLLAASSQFSPSLSYGQKNKVPWSLEAKWTRH